jgi:hypothetical protein
MDTTDSFASAVVDAITVDARKRAKIGTSRDWTQAIWAALDELAKQSLSNYIQMRDRTKANTISILSCRSLVTVRASVLSRSGYTGGNANRLTQSNGLSISSKESNAI